jgi:hypothetical protein
MRAAALKGKLGRWTGWFPQPKIGRNLGFRWGGQDRGTIMRHFVLAVAVAAALSAPAAAQTPYQSGYTTTVLPLGELSKESQGWLVNETMKQALQVMSLADLDKEIESSIGNELDPIGAHHHATHDDMVSAVRYTIVTKARELLAADIKERQKLYAKDKSDENMLDLQGAIGRKTRLDALCEQAKRRLSRAASQIAAD